MTELVLVSGYMWTYSVVRQRSVGWSPSLLFQNRKWGENGRQNCVCPSNTSTEWLSLATSRRSVPVLGHFCPGASLSPEECQGGVWGLNWKPSLSSGWMAVHRTHSPTLSYPLFPHTQRRSRKLQRAPVCVFLLIDQRVHTSHQESAVTSTIQTLESRLCSGLKKVLLALFMIHQVVLKSGN